MSIIDQAKAVQAAYELMDQFLTEHENDIDSKMSDKLDRIFHHLENALRDEQ